MLTKIDQKKSNKKIVKTVATKYNQESRANLTF